jgi:serine/threonine protein kinase
MSKVFTITEGLENLGALRTGGQGSVYKGRRTGTVYTAIKLMPTPIHTESEDDRNYRNFQNEVAKLQKVNEQPNPNVVKIMSWGLTDSGSFPFIEMEYVDGPDLCDLLNPPHERVFLLKELIKLADQLAGALAHCHKVGVKHGDIKSNNVKYNVHSGNYVLLDFGLAILTDEQRRSSIRHAGAIEFMAPEQHEGQMLPQTDVYSYGVILYELLAGEVPFPLNSNGETGRNMVMLAHQETPVPDVLTKRRERLPESWDVEKKFQEMRIPEWLLRVISKCLEKNPQNRYADGIALQGAVVNGILSTNTEFQQDDTSVNSVQNENEQLQAQLLQLQQADEAKQRHLNELQKLVAETGITFDKHSGIYQRNRNIVNVPKRAFVGLVGAVAVFMVLFAYSFFSKKEPVSYTPAYGKVSKNYRSPYIFIKRYNNDSIVNARKIAALKVEQLTNTKGGRAEAAKKKKFKKKKKKFLGLF